MKERLKFLNSYKTHFGFAILIRILLIWYGEIRDGECKLKDCVKYTDIDYNVFSDAANYVFQNKSPYLRDTYRYTPILACILQPNVFLFASFGKVLFVIFDVACAYLMIKINEIERKNDLKQKDEQKENELIDKYNLISICFWFYNPLTIAVSSRGNAESIMSFIVLLFLYYLLKNSYFLAGLLFSFAIHFKIYPITYSLAVLLFILFENKSINLRVITNFSKLAHLFQFGCAFLIGISSLTYYFYLKYGYEFLFETYIYHITRKDIRHNFSAYFYILYLFDNSELSNSLLFKLCNFLPQFLLIFIISVFLYKHLKLCLFLITYSFVTFNKVCTSQYFIWYLSLIPILIPHLRVSLRRAVSCFVLWMVGQGLWLYHAYLLEFEGENTFFRLWICGLVFLTINCFIMNYVFLSNYKFQKKKEN